MVTKELTGGALPSMPMRRQSQPARVSHSRTADGEEPGIELVGMSAALRPDAEWFVIEQVIAGGGAAPAGSAPETTCSPSMASP
jgi:hypothetical protein